jgi:hypothetical protein
MNGANSASFWAQKNHEVKTLATLERTPAVAPFKQNGTVAETKKRIVLKGWLPVVPSVTATNHGTGVNNGASVASSLKMTNWADSDDDEEFIASCSAKQGPRTTTLEHELAHRDARIEGLEAAVGTKNARIAELEAIVEAKEQRIASLMADAQNMDSQVQRLDEHNHTQFLYVQELVGEVDERNRRVQELEAELDVKGGRIRTLELCAASQPDASTDTVDKVMVEAAAQAKLVEQVSCSIATATANKIDDTVLEVPLPKTPPIARDTDPIFDDTSNSISPVEASVGPAINDSKFPKLWSPDMLRKAAPVEKPKVLKMAIDTTKFGKKPALVTNNSDTLNGKRFIAPTYGQSTKPHTKTDVVPKFQMDKDIRQMPHAERILFANGPIIAINIGTVELATLPKYILMQCSAKAYKHFTDLPNATAIAFPVGSMDTEAAKAHIQWMHEMTYQGRVYSLTLNADEKFDTKNLKICQAARVMGLTNTYVGHFTKVLCDRVRSRNPSIEFMSSICELANPENDPIFECLANNLVNQQISNTPKKPDNLAKLVIKYPLLKQRMAIIEQRVKDSRAKEKRKNGGGRSRDVQSKNAATH